MSQQIETEDDFVYHRPPRKNEIPPTFNEVQAVADLGRSRAHLSQWLDIRPYYAEMKALADRIERNKSGYKSARMWNPHPTLPGLFGERVFAAITKCEPNLEYYEAGDIGFDFQCYLPKIEGRAGVVTIDVKSSTYVEVTSELLVRVEEITKADVFVHCISDLFNYKAIAMGWMPADELKNAPVINHGYGDNYGLQTIDLYPMDDMIRLFSGFHAVKK